MQSWALAGERPGVNADEPGQQLRPAPAPGKGRRRLDLVPYYVCRISSKDHHLLWHADIVPKRSIGWSVDGTEDRFSESLYLKSENIELYGIFYKVSREKSGSERQIGW